MGRRFKSCRARQLSDFCRVYAMESRDPLLQDFLTNLAEAFRAQAMRPEASAAVGRIYGALKTPRPAGAAVPRRRPVCRPLAEALATASSGSAPVARVADAFSAMEPSLDRSEEHTSEIQYLM